MKEKYDFLEEGPWQQTAGNAIGALARNGGFVNGAVAGGAIGAAGGVLNNALKSDQDPTKKGAVSSAIGGAMTGAATGAIIGRAGGALARSSMGKGAQKELFKQAANVHAKDAISRDIANGRYNLPENPTQAQKDEVLKAANERYKQVYDAAMNSRKSGTAGLYSFHSGPWTGDTMTYDPAIMH